MPLHHLNIQFGDGLAGPNREHGGLNNELGWKFNQNNFRYEFPDLESIGLDTFIKSLGVILYVLCIYVSEILKVSLPRIGP